MKISFLVLSALFLILKYLKILTYIFELRSLLFIIYDFYYNFLNTLVF